MQLIATGIIARQRAFKNASIANIECQQQCTTPTRAARAGASAKLTKFEIRQLEYRTQSQQPRTADSRAAGYLGNILDSRERKSLPPAKCKAVSEGDQAMRGVWQ